MHHVACSSCSYIFESAPQPPSSSVLEQEEVSATIRLFSGTVVYQAESKYRPYAANGNRMDVITGRQLGPSGQDETMKRPTRITVHSLTGLASKRFEMRSHPLFLETSRCAKLDSPFGNQKNGTIISLHAHVRREIEVLSAPEAMGVHL